MIEPFEDPFSLQIWKSKYKGINENKVEDMWERLSNILSSVEKDDEKEYYKKEFYRILSEFNTLGGRIMSNLGVPGTVSEFNCTVSGPKFRKFRNNHGIDSMPSIMNELQEQAMILKSECGYGMNFDWLRPRGTFVKGNRSESPGPVRIMDMWNAVSDVITSGAGKVKNKNAKKDIRKGAQMGVLSCWHPDVEQFVDAKQIPDKLNKFNISVGITDDFIEAVKKNKTWDLIYPDIEHSKYNKEWNGDIERWKIKKLPIKIYKTMKARELWDKIMKATYNRSEPGVLFIDRVNQLNNLAYIEKIYSTNPCVSGDTEIQTTEGLFTISEMTKQFNKTGRIFDVYCMNRENGKLEIKQAINIFKTKEVNKLIKINFSNGSYLKCTPEHEIYIDKNKKVKASDLLYYKYSIYFQKNKNEFSKLKVNSIDEIVYENPEPVYDITVDKHHNFIANGIVISNCGEQPLAPNNVCNLGSLNLVNYVDLKNKDWDYEKLKKDIAIHIRMLDNVNDLGKAPMYAQNQEIKGKRRIGQGVLGYGSALYLLHIKYGSKEALKMTEKFCNFWANEAYKASANLASEKGSFPEYIEEEYLKSKYIKVLNKDTIETIREFGIRNSHILSIAPTGNSSIYANVASGGIEPVFNYNYIRTIEVTGNPPEGLIVYDKEAIDFKSKPEYKAYENNNNIINWKWRKEGDENILKIKYNNIIYKIDKNRGLTKEVECKDHAMRTLEKLEEWDPKADYVVSVSNKKLTVEDHINTMQTFSKYVDSALSKTINLPYNYSYENFKDIYMKAYDSGYIKGITTYRAGTMATVLKDKNEQLNKNNKEHIVIDEVKLPMVSPSETFTMEAYDQKFYLTTCYWSTENKIPFAIFCKSNYKMKNGKCLIEAKNNLIELARIKKVRKRHIDKVLKKIEETNADNIDSFMRALSLTLRHGISMETIVSEINKVQPTIGSFLFKIKKYLASYIADGVRVDEKCPNCKIELTYIEGCLSCKSCGWSKC